MASGVVFTSILLRSRVQKEISDTAGTFEPNYLGAIEDEESSSQVKTLGPVPWNTKGGSITVLLTSCLTGLESAVLQMTIFVFIYKTDLSKQV